MLAKKKSAPEPSLLERIHQLRSDIDAFVEQKVMDLKNSRTVKAYLSATFGTCLCAAIHVCAERLRDCWETPMPNWSPPMLGFDAAGSIPKDAIEELVTVRGIADLLDIIKVRHESGGTSLIVLKSYLSGREKFQGETLDWIWFDEEPPADIYTEGLTRTNVGNGPVWMTFTPLRGVSEVVRRFLHERSPDRQVVSMTIDDVDHYKEEEKKRIIAARPTQKESGPIRGAAS